MQGKDQHLNDIQYEFVVEDDPVDLSYHQMQEEKQQCDVEEKVLIINVQQRYIRKMFFAVTSAKSVAIFHTSVQLVKGQAGAFLFNKDNK